MATENQESDSVTEHCGECGQERPHEIAIELLTERHGGANVEYSREPYRIAECRACGTTSKSPVNDA